MRYTIALSLASLIAAAPALRAEVPVVVTDIVPVHALVAGVMGDLGAPVLLLDRGADAHDFQLRPSQAAALQGAGLVVWIGPEMTPWLDRALGGSGAAQLRLLGVEGTHLQDFGAFGGGDGHDHDHAAEAGHDHGHDHAAKAGHDHGHDHAAKAGHDHGHDHAAKAGHDHGHDHAAKAGHDHGHDHDHAAEAKADDHAHDDHAGHDHSGTDPHAWLDPANAAVWVTAIAAELGRLDPANAAAYAANAEATRAAIAATEAEVTALLEPAQDRPFVVFHDAYGYFAGHFGLNVAAAVAAGDAASPGAARLRDLQSGMGAGAALCIFPEANHDPRLVEQMAQATGVRLGGVLDPEGAMVDPGPEAWSVILRGMATTIADCLGQGA